MVEQNQILYSMVKKTTTKVTSDKVAKEASKILKDDRYSKASKSVAGSALSQKQGKKGK